MLKLPMRYALRHYDIRVDRKCPVHYFSGQERTRAAFTSREEAPPPTMYLDIWA